MHGMQPIDEDLFRVLPAEALTVKLGIMASLAKYNLKDQQGILRLMDHLQEGDR